MTDSASDALRMIDDWERNATEKAARFQRMTEQVEQVSITESVAGGAVSVTVGHNGMPTGITMTDGVRSMEPGEIAGNVMAAIRKAQSRYPERLAEILAETVGDADPAAHHILATARANFPPAPEEEIPEVRHRVERMSIGDVEEDEPRSLSRPAPPRPVRPEDDNGEEDFGAGPILRK